MKKEWVHLMNPIYLGMKQTLEKVYGIGPKGFVKEERPYIIHNIFSYNGENSRVIRTSYKTDNQELTGEIITDISQEDIQKILRAKGISVINTEKREAIAYRAIEIAANRGLQLLKGTLRSTYNIDTGFTMNCESYSNKSHVPIDPKSTYLFFDVKGKISEDKEKTNPQKAIAISLGFSVSPSETLDKILRREQ